MDALGSISGFFQGIANGISGFFGEIGYLSAFLKLMLLLIGVLIFFAYRYAKDEYYHIKETQTKKEFGREYF